MIPSSTYWTFCPESIQINSINSSATVTSWDKSVTEQYRTIKINGFPPTNDSKGPLKVIHFCRMP